MECRVWKSPVFFFSFQWLTGLNLIHVRWFNGSPLLGMSQKRKQASGLLNQIFLKTENHIWLSFILIPFFRLHISCQHTRHPTLSKQHLQCMTPSMNSNCSTSINLSIITRSRLRHDNPLSTIILAKPTGGDTPLSTKRPWPIKHRWRFL